MNCERNEFDWCEIHDTPFLEILEEMRCLHVFGINFYGSSPYRRMYEIGVGYRDDVAQLRNTIESREDEGWHDPDYCSHDDCYSYDHAMEIAEERATEAVKNHPLVAEYLNLLDRIEKGDLPDYLEMHMYRKQFGQRGFDNAPLW